MNDTIKNRLDAIDAQMADLQKEQAKLREELDKPDFVPGWFIAWDGESLNDKGNTPTLFYFADQSEKEECEEAYENIAPFTPELAARFFPKTRYDWAKIVKEYPEAQWATTDADGRMAFFDVKPDVVEVVAAWMCGGGCLDHAEYTTNVETPDWRDSLEARPEGM
jgi:hypothetical protein